MIVAQLIFNIIVLFIFTVGFIARLEDRDLTVLEKVLFSSIIFIDLILIITYFVK